MKSSDLVVIAAFPSPVEAEIARGVLDEAGIESMIRADNAGGLYPTLGESELLVRSEDRARAHEALQPPTSRSTG